MNYVTAIKEVIKAEGGSRITNNPKDPGKLTKFGISQKSYPDLDIANLTEDQAVAIYKRDYWDRILGDQLPYNVAYAIFNYAVNRGVVTAIRYAQAASGAIQDGVMGMGTLSAILAKGEKAFLEQFLALAKKGYEDLVAVRPDLESFLDGWKNRIDHVSAYVGVKPAILAGGSAVLIAGIFFLILYLSPKARTT
jgi:lysozyme family protein